MNERVSASVHCGLKEAAVTYDYCSQRKAFLEAFILGLSGPLILDLRSLLPNSAGQVGGVALALAQSLTSP